jgi:hypothetical protein
MALLQNRVGAVHYQGNNKRLVAGVVAAEIGFCTGSFGGRRQELYYLRNIENALLYTCAVSVLRWQVTPRGMAGPCVVLAVSLLILKLIAVHLPICRCGAFIHTPS